VQSLPVPRVAAPARAAFTWPARVAQAAAAGAGVLALGALVLPPLTSRRDSLLASSCQSNLRHIGVALSVYAADYDDRLPPPGAWTTPVASEPGGMRWLRCPGDVTRAVWPSYGFEEPLAGRALGAVPLRASTPLVFEGRFDRFIPRHRQRGNVMFADFHLAAVRRLASVQPAQ
jgi:prepilin-type processing-associated H-X9-DG protein